MTLPTPFTLTGCSLLATDPVGDELRIYAHGNAPEAECPSCHRRSDHTCSYYTRSPADLPICEQSVRLVLRVRRFRCRDEDCPRITFSEPLPNLLQPYARRTNRLAETQCHLGFAVGAEAGARLSAWLRMPTSPDTVLRMLHKHPLPEYPPPRVLGVDDWAWRRDHAWGTILLDLEKHQPVDLLPNRTADTLAHWLKTHPGIEVVARDRSTEYARGISVGAPQAVQVADRWHLLHNLRRVLERFSHGAKSRLKDLPGLDSIGSAVVNPPKRRTKREIAASQAARQVRYERYVEARRLCDEGLSISQISRALGMSRVTVRKYLSAAVFPEWTRHPPRPSILAPYQVYLEERWAQGAWNACGLFRELEAQGYAGSRRPVTRWVQERRTEPHPCTPAMYRASCLSRSELPHQQGKLPAPRRLAWLLTRDPEALSPNEEQLLCALRKDPMVHTAHSLTRSYVAMIREQKAHELDSWIGSCSASEIDGFETFAAGLKQDYDAVRAALTEPWSNGQAEGQTGRPGDDQTADVWPRWLRPTSETSTLCCVARKVRKNRFGGR